MQSNAVFAPMIIASIGVFLSILGIFLVRTKEDATIKTLMSALNRGVNTSAVLIAACAMLILYLLGFENWLGLSFSVIAGLLAGIIIGQGTEYFTSHAYRPTQNIAKSAQTGPATVIIAGMGSGMISTVIPVITIVIAILVSYLSPIGFDVENMLTGNNLSMGLYGIAIAAVGMLSTLGITLATDAYGPIGDKAGGNAEMIGLEPSTSPYGCA
jgi:K(+)-stimulated pyrophosphate-energized sodium pump